MQNKKNWQEMTRSKRKNIQYEQKIYWINRKNLKKGACKVNGY